MIKTLKFSIGAFVATLAIFGMFSQVSAFTTSSDTTASGCASGAMYNTITGAACTNVTMDPPALPWIPYGCDLGVGTVYSPETGESCSVGGVTITPPIVMVYPWDVYGCKAGSPYSMTTGAKCAGFNTSTSVTTISGCEPGVMYDTRTGAKCAGYIQPIPQVYDCMTAKNAFCAGVMGSAYTMPVNDVCVNGSIRRYNTVTGVAYCSGGTTTTPPTWVPPIRVNIYSSASDIMALQTSLNRALVGKLAIALVVDGRWGMKTTEAVKIFQAQAGIAVDGKVGPITSAKLSASAY